MGVFSSVYSSDEDSFWKDFSKPNTLTGVITRLNWSEICQKAQDIRLRINSEDAEAARIKYNGQDHPAFETVFSYRKGSERRVLKMDADIARKYRDMEKMPRPWDK